MNRIIHPLRTRRTRRAVERASARVIREDAARGAYAAAEWRAALHLTSA